MSAIVCVKCEHAIKRSETYVVCSGWCENYFHAKCEGIKEDEFKLINSKEYIGWFCPTCVQKKGVDAKNTLQQIVEVIKKMKIEMQKQAETMSEQEKQIGELISVINSNKNEIRVLEVEKVIEKQNSYADKLKIKKHEPVVVIKPKNTQQKSADTKTDIKKHFDPTKIEIAGLKNASNGGILVECKNKQAVEKFKEEASAKLGENYEINIPKKRFPKIKIIGISEKLTDSQVIDSIKAQNTYLDQEGTVIKIFSNKKAKNRINNYIIYAEVDCLTYRTMLQQDYINIGWDRCKVFDAINVLRCFKCNGFNHKAGDCKTELACPRCSEKHQIENCKADDNQIKCVNCIKAVDRLKIKLDTSHCAWSTECPVYKRKLDIERNKINFLE